MAFKAEVHTPDTFLDCYDLLNRVLQNAATGIVHWVKLFPSFMLGCFINSFQFVVGFLEGVRAFFDVVCSCLVLVVRFCTARTGEYSI